jgi:DnaK suppressor protein
LRSSSRIFSVIGIGWRRFSQKAPGEPCRRVRIAEVYAPVEFYRVTLQHHRVDIMICDIIAAYMDAKQGRTRLIEEQKQRRALAERLRGHEADAERDRTALTILEGELEDIDHALGRIEDGSYGTCEECGKAIGDDRLEAKPWARFCIVHQLELEKAGARR